MDTKIFNQYKADIFQKIGVDFVAGKSILDVGAGDCTDAKIFKDNFGMEVLATDIYKSENADAWKIPFELCSVYEIGKLHRRFDYVFLHDVLHHIDEDNQSRENHIRALEALKEVTTPGGTIIIIEGNRHNPLFYPHMVKMLGHEHFAQKYFKSMISEVFPDARFLAFEAHAYPPALLPLFKIYEKIMESMAPKALLSYNAAIVQNHEK